MLRGLFPRLFGQYREGGIITARWQHTASGSVWTRLTPTKSTSHQDITVTDRGTGLLTIAFPACNDAAVLACYLEPLGDAITDVHQVTPRLLTPSSGSMQAVVTSLDATPVVEDPADGAILCITMMCNK
jgi:hypothetical protein